MKWTAVIVVCLSHLTLSHTHNSLVNSATRKFFFADSHENIDERPGVASYHDDVELLPFGNLEDNTAAQYRTTQLTIEQFINKLKRIKKSKEKKPGHSREKSAPKSSKKIKSELLPRPKPSKSKQANVPLPSTNDHQTDKKVVNVPGKSKKTPSAAQHQPKRKEAEKGVVDNKRQKQFPKNGISNQTTNRKPGTQVKSNKSVNSSNKKQKKYHKPDFGTEASKKIKQQVEEDFFQSGPGGPVEAQTGHHIHQESRQTPKNRGFFPNYFFPSNPL